MKRKINLKAARIEDVFDFHVSKKYAVDWSHPNVVKAVSYMSQRLSDHIDHEILNDMKNNPKTSHFWKKK